VLAVLGAITFALTFRAMSFGRAGSGNFPGGGLVQGGPQFSQSGGGGPSFQVAPGSGGSAQGPGTFSSDGSGSARQVGGPGLFRLFGVLGFLGPALPIVRGAWIVLVIGLTVVAAWFIWKRQKRWALNLGMVLALLALLGTLPGILLGGGRMLSLGGFPLLMTGLNVLKAAASLPVIIFGMLPSVREFFS
jgi:hypothetical protein